MKKLTRGLLAATVAVSVAIGASSTAYYILRSNGAQANAPAAQAPQATPVSVAFVEQRDVAIWDEFSGRLEAIERVEVRSRVAGAVQSAHFREGALVKRDDLLVTIDPAPYAAEVDRLQAQVAAAEARVLLTKSDVERGEQDGQRRPREGPQRQPLRERGAGGQPLARERLCLRLTRAEAVHDFAAVELVQRGVRAHRLLDEPLDVGAVVGDRVAVAGAAVGQAAGERSPGRRAEPLGTSGIELLVVGDLRRVALAVGVLVGFAREGSLEALGHDPILVPAGAVVHTSKGGCVSNFSTL